MTTSTTSAKKKSTGTKKSTDTVHYGVTYASDINATGLGVEIACHASGDAPHTQRKSDVTCPACLATWETPHEAPAAGETPAPAATAAAHSAPVSQPAIRLVTDLSATPKPQSAYAISWTTCFVCHTGTACPEQNGRCADCYAFFRHTGTDRTPAELATTQGTAIERILSNGLLRDTKPALLAPATTQDAQKQDTHTQKRVAAPVHTVARKASSPSTRQERVGKPCSQGCGTTIYGATVSMCVPCWKALTKAQQAAFTAAQKAAKVSAHAAV